jgi:phosphate acetyltransferase
MAFGIEPKVAMLLFIWSTGKGEMKLDKVRKATQIVRENAQTLKLRDQFNKDAAVDKMIGFKQNAQFEVALVISVDFFLEYRKQYPQSSTERNWLLKQ